jgi:hypothetical protein
VAKQKFPFFPLPISTPRAFFSVEQRKRALMRGRQLGVGGNGGGRKGLERAETKNLFSIPKCEIQYDAKNPKMKTVVQLVKLFFPIPVLG